jgi:hypothetical protein
MPKISLESPDECFSGVISGEQVVKYYLQNKQYKYSYIPVEPILLTTLLCCHTAYI